MSKATTQVIVPTAATRVAEELAREESEHKPQITNLPLDKLGHRPLANPDQAHFSEKIYWFPDSYNALRIELVEYWPNLWGRVGYRMAFKAEEFVEEMNSALDLTVQFDTQKVEATCLLYLNALRKLRGVSTIN